MTLLITGCSSNDDSPSAGGGGGSDPFVQPEIFTGFPVTLKDALGDDSTSYKGQMARHVLRETVKAVVKTPNTTVETETADIVNRYLKNDSNIADDDNIVAPVDKTGFDIKEMVYNELGTGRNLYGKTYDTVVSGQADPIPGVAPAEANITMGVPGNKSARETLDLWVVDFANNNATTGDVYVNMTTGYDYNQLFPKFLMGAVFYNQSMDKYLDEHIADAGTQDNDKPYNDDPAKPYTGKEHSRDEGFGDWGAAANYGTLTAEQNYRIKKQNAANFADADWDWDSDSMVSVYGIHLWPSLLRRFF